jgi:hypothetical protein
VIGKPYVPYRRNGPSPARARRKLRASAHESAKAPLSCSGDIYEIIVHASGDVTHLSEVWHP